MKAILTPIVFGIIFLNISAFADPQLTSWLTDYSGQYVRAYTNTTERTSGTTKTAWVKQSVPVYADVPFVASSASWVYVRCPDLPSYVIGPWLNPNFQPGQFYPTNQHYLARFPRSPAVQSGTKDITSTGDSGLWVNGVEAFNFTDGKAWDPTNLDIVAGSHNKASFYWHRNAPALWAEKTNFDYAFGHQIPAGAYHTHQQAIALRYQLGDHVDYNSSTKNYSESAGAPTSHSPILGWSYDGYPIYGPYGYSISNDASSGIRRMVSGYVQRDGKNGTDNLTNNLTTIPAWYARFRQNHFNAPYSTTTPQSRPAVQGTNTLGTFAEDYDYYGDITNSATGHLYIMGTNTFDLDEYNGRYCVTPEFPGGTYAYFVDIDSNGNSAYPYTFAYEFYGNDTGGSVNNITESVTTNFVGGADSSLALNTPTANASYVVSLVWSSAEGGTYQVESSTNKSNWTLQKSGVAATVNDVSTTTNYTSSVSNGTVYVRVTRTALADYDRVGFESGVVTQMNTNSFLIGNDAPTMANPIPNQTNTYGSGFSYTFPANTFTDIDSGQTLTYSASSSVLTNTGISFNSSTRTFSATTIDATNGGTIAGNYNVQVIATDNGTPAMSATDSFAFVIGKAAASVTASNASRAYGSANPVFTGTLSNFIAADSITANYSSVAPASSVVGTYSIIPTLNDSRNVLENYLVTTNNGALTVTQTSLTVTPNNLSRAYGRTNPILTGTFSGLQNSDNITGDYSTTATTTSPVGTYPITLTSLNDPDSKLSNYIVTTNFGTLTITNPGETLYVSFQFSVESYDTNGDRSDFANLIYAPTGVAFDTAGNLYVADLYDGTINKFTFDGSSTTFAAGLVYPIALAFDGASNLFVSSINNQILKITTNGVSSVFVGTNLNNPQQIAFDHAGNLFVANSGSNDVVKFSPKGSSSIFATNLNEPAGLAFDSAGNLFVSTMGDNKIWKFSSGGVGSVFGTNGLKAPLGLAFDNEGNLYAASSGGTTLEKFTTNGVGSVFGTNNLANPQFIAMWPIPSQLIPSATTNISYSALTITASNSLIALATNGTMNFTFTDSTNDVSVVIAVTMTPYSASNASPYFIPIDFYNNGSPQHASIGPEDGNWVDSWEGENFSASLVSADSGINTDSIKFGIAGIGFRSDQGYPRISWTSSATTSSLQPNADGLYTLDTAQASLNGTNYSGQLRSTSDGAYQLSDDSSVSGNGIAFTVYFTEGTPTQGANATLSSINFTNQQLQFTVSGTSDANYIVQATTNLSSANWISISTNAAPFTFTESNVNSYSQRFYRVVAQ